MKKVLKKKLSGTKKLVRRVLSRSSITSHDSIPQHLEDKMTEEEEVLRNELEALKDQISNLKAAIRALQKETEHKDLSIVNLAREKEKLH
ncbi:unnamed protein product [Callosobruchus maculatus]|uniref:Uncharacterized protein n=2 Tax=Callosobruchus maculatus TaxID=64391 RepID=A0A653C6S5_CALMS|nr:unnamed protein product [Callosobruchus maculatus]